MMTQHALLVGMGKSGLALHKVLEKKGISHSCYDDTGLSTTISLEEAVDLIHRLKDSLLVVPSPGIKPSHYLIKDASKEGCTLATEIDLAFHLSQTSLPPFIGVTGTNGKTTVVEFLSFALSSHGIRAETVGNIGIPLIDRVFLQEKPLPDLFVIELSSFQLEYTKRCPLSCAAYLNFAPDHLEWHETLSAYNKAKCAIFSHVLPAGLRLAHASVPTLEKGWTTFSASMKTDIGTDGENVYIEGKKIGELPQNIRGKLLHDTENFLASCGLLVPRFLPYGAVKEAWEQFEKGPHRIQLIETIQTVSFWDDSKATNISSTEAAVKFLEGPIVLIAGGVHKGFSYSSWKDSFKNRVRAVVAIGQAKKYIQDDLSPDCPVLLTESLEEALFMAATLVPQRGHILLSPGCSSFDMFQNYKERGNQFQRLVKDHRQKFIHMWSASL